MKAEGSPLKNESNVIVLDLEWGSISRTYNIQMSTYWKVDIKEQKRLYCNWFNEIHYDSIV